MNRQLQYAVAATALLGFIASAYPSEAQRRGAGGRAPTSVQHPGGGGGSQYRGGGNRVNTGNVNVGNSVNVNVDQGWNARPVQPIYRPGPVRPVVPVAPVYRPVYRPVAAGIAIGATAAAIGSRAYALPGGCNPYPYASYTYYSCSGVYYRPQYQGDTVVYVVVSKPG